jgi:uncharacterized YccA/Bax inhibitor family protein
MSIGISIFVIIIAALNLFLDFDRIDKGVKKSMPKYMEWCGTMGMIITLAWLNVEFLRLFSKISRKLFVYNKKANLSIGFFLCCNIFKCYKIL